MKPEDKKNFIDIANSVGELVQEKNIAYGDSFAKSQQIVSVLYPNGVQPEQYMDMLAITRVIDKLFRIATKKDAFGESPWRDICGYAILGIANDEVEDEEGIARESTTQSVKDERVIKSGSNSPYHEVDGVMYTARAWRQKQEAEIEKANKRNADHRKKMKREGHANPYANVNVDEHDDAIIIEGDRTFFGYNAHDDKDKQH